jgi:hypothetical protein
MEAEDMGCQGKYVEVGNMRNQCAEKVRGRNSWDRSRCSRNAVRDGFCKQHHPEAKEERKRKSEALWEANQKASPLGRLKVALATIADQKATIEALQVAAGDLLGTQWVAVTMGTAELPPESCIRYEAALKDLAALVSPKQSIPEEQSE